MYQEAQVIKLLHICVHLDSTIKLNFKKICIH